MRQTQDMYQQFLKMSRQILKLCYTLCIEYRKEVEHEKKVSIS